MTKNIYVNMALPYIEKGWSWRKIAKEVGVPRSTLSDALRAYYKAKELPASGVEPEKLTTAIVGASKRDFRGKDSDSVQDNSRILVISDMHIPYHHPDTLEFLAYLRDKYQPTRIICMGDELDKHSLSYHDHDPDLDSAGTELRKSLPVIAQLFTMFPVMDILESNHGSLVWRKAKTHGIPKHYIKAYNEVLGVDSGWRWWYDLTIKLPNGQSCYFHHGKSSDVKNLSQLMGMCAVQGHYHESFKVDYWGNPNGLFWAMQTACLIEDSSLAFSYNNVNVKRPIIGTGLIIDSQPVLEPMLLGNDVRWVLRKV